MATLAWASCGRRGMKRRRSTSQTCSPRRQSSLPFSQRGSPSLSRSGSASTKPTRSHLAGPQPVLFRPSAAPSVDRAFCRACFRRGGRRAVAFRHPFAATGWLLYRLTSELFGPRAGLVALFGVNATPFFFASAGTWIMPDGPLLFGLALAALALSPLFFDPGADERRVWRLWPLAGLGFGLAGLSKYIGALAPLGSSRSSRFAV